MMQQKVKTTRAPGLRLDKNRRLTPMQIYCWATVVCLAVFALLDKNRQDQIVRRKRRFTDESAGKAVMTVAAHAHHRKLTKSLHRIASKVLKQERPGAGCAALDASIGISRKDQRPSHPSRVARSSSTPVFFSPEKYCTETGFTQVSARFFTAAITSRRSETVLN